MRKGKIIENRNWFDIWEEGLERNLKRKNSCVRNVFPGLLEALRNDLAAIAKCPRRPPVQEFVEGRSRKSQTLVSKLDREFAREIGIKLDSERPNNEFNDCCAAGLRLDERIAVGVFCWTSPAGRRESVRDIFPALSIVAENALARERVYVRSH